MYIFNFEKTISDLPLREVIAFAETEAVTDNVRREYLLTRLLAERNVLSTVCTERITPGESLQQMALADLTVLFTDREGNRFLRDYRPSVKRTLPFAEYQASLQDLVATNDVEELLDKLIAHYTTFGYGVEAKYIAYRWEEGLIGIPHPDTASLDKLYCVERQKKVLIDNTEAFLHGRPANNVLLYGNSGCGKSSMVKALLNEYYKDGLRLIQLDKERLNDLPALVKEVKERRFRYIIFMDDLSFEGEDDKYKALKTLLEGGIETQPDNVLFYATSNRFHLVNESWASRQGDDVHRADTESEKLSLSERFGIRISFLSPAQNDYLKIIEGLLAEHDIAMTPTLRAEALKWEVFYNGKSGRTATQFVRAVLSGSIPQ